MVPVTATVERTNLIFAFAGTAKEEGKVCTVNLPGYRYIRSTADVDADIKSSK